MFGIENYLLFLAAGVMLNITPGPDILYVATRSGCQGRGAGVVSALAFSTGGLVHTSAAALGLSAILLYSATAYEVIRYAGAAYLIWMGLRMIVSANGKGTHRSMKRQPLWAIYRQGVMVSILNPKVALFFLAFLPQFADAASAQFTQQIVVLGLTFCFTGTLTLLAVALGFGYVNAWAKGRPGAHRLQARLTGSVFLTMGLGLGLAGGRD